VPRDVTTRFRMEGLKEAAEQAAKLRGELQGVSGAASGAATVTGGPLLPQHVQQLRQMFGGRLPPGLAGLTAGGGAVIPPGGFAGLLAGAPAGPDLLGYNPAAPYTPSTIQSSYNAPAGTQPYLPNFLRADAALIPPGGAGVGGSGGGGAGGGGGFGQAAGFAGIARGLGFGRVGRLFAPLAGAYVAERAVSAATTEAEFRGRFPEAGSSIGRQVTESMPIVSDLLQKLRELADVSTRLARHFNDISLGATQRANEGLLGRYRLEAGAFGQLQAGAAGAAGARFAAEESARTVAQMTPDVLASLRPRALPFEATEQTGAARLGVIEAAERQRVAQREAGFAQQQYADIQRRPENDVTSLQKGVGMAEGAYRTQRALAELSLGQLAKNPRIGSLPTDKLNTAAEAGLRGPYLISGSIASGLAGQVRTGAEIARGGLEEAQLNVDTRRQALGEALTRQQEALNQAREKSLALSRADYELEKAKLAVQSDQVQLAGQRAQTARAGAQYAGGAAPGTLEQTLAAIQQIKQFGVEGASQEQLSLVRAHPAGAPWLARVEEQAGRTGYRGEINTQINREVGLGDFTGQGGRNVGGRVEDIEAQFNRMQDDLQVRQKQAFQQFNENVSNVVGGSFEELARLITQALLNGLRQLQTKLDTQGVGSRFQQNTAPP
jgi:hypothetical protein